MRDALRKLPEQKLLELLKSPDEGVRARATQLLWQRWFLEKGLEGLVALQTCEALVHAGEGERAEAFLTELVQRRPDFAEGWNRRAVLRFNQQRHREAIEDCERAVKLKPWHFGALHGLGLSHMALGEYAAAAEAFRRALELQPFSVANQVLFRQCSLHLN